MQKFSPLVRTCSVSFSSLISPRLFFRNMTVGKNILDDKIKVTTAEGKELSVKDLFSGKKVVVFGVPGAFTPVCSNQHVPAFLSKANELKGKGIDTIACLSVNDKFTMKAWAEKLGAQDNKIEFISDWDASLTKHLGMDIDLSAAGLGLRSKRFSMMVDNGKITFEQVEESPADFKISGPDDILKHLGN